MKKRFLEKDFQALVSKYLRTKAWASFPYELKISKGKTLPFSKFEPQQLPSLVKAKHGILHYKMSDASLGCKPCDGFVFKGSEAYVGIMYNVNEQQDTAHFIDIDDVMEIKNDGQRSIKLKDIQAISIEINFKEKL